MSSPLDAAIADLEERKAEIQVAIDALTRVRPLLHQIAGRLPVETGAIIPATRTRPQVKARGPRVRQRHRSALRRKPARPKPRLVSGVRANRLDEQKAVALRLIREQGPQNTKALATLVGCSLYTMRRALMAAAAKGDIESVGTTNGQRWQLVHYKTPTRAEKAPTPKEAP